MYEIKIYVCFSYVGSQLHGLKKENVSLYWRKLYPWMRRVRNKWVMQSVCVCVRARTRVHA